MCRYYDYCVGHMTVESHDYVGHMTVESHDYVGHMTVDHMIM